MSQSLAIPRTATPIQGFLDTLQEKNDQAQGGTMEYVETLLVGGGPAGLALLMAARGGGTLESLLDAGLLIVDKSNTFGSGQLGDYAIRSDSHADSFVSSARLVAEPSLSHLFSSGPGEQLMASLGRPVELATPSAFLADVAIEFDRWLKAKGHRVFVGGTEAVNARQNSDGRWLTRCHNVSRGLFEIQSTNLVLATGAEQSEETLHRANSITAALLPRFSHKLVASRHLLGKSCQAILHERLERTPSPRIVIVGGSHSAVSCARVILNSAIGRRLQAGAVTLVHRRPLRLTYDSPSAARLDGFHDFDPEDICPHSGRVFPLAGFRCDSRDFVRQALGLGGLEPDPRIELMRTTACLPADIEARLEDADLVVAALGYRPRGLPLFDSDGQAIVLLSQTNSSRPMVDHRSRVLDSTGNCIPSVFGIGLAAGYPLATRFGEPSFDGQANGLALWQAAVGEELIGQLLQQNRKSQVALND